MRKLYCLLLLFPLLCFSQNITYNGTIHELGTNAPVEMVSIGVAHSNLGTLSNEEGKFRITVPQGTTKLLLSHISYKALDYQLDPKNTTFDLVLESAGFDLEEVFLTNRPIKDILEEVVSVSKKKLGSALLLHTYGREFVNVNNKFVKFSDGLLDYYIGKKNGDSDLQVLQSRAFKLNDADAESREKTAADALTLFDIRDAVSDAYNFKQLKRIQNSKDYDFELKVKTDKSGNTVHVIRILPNAAVHTALYAGTITYDPKTNLILELDLKKSEDHQQYSNLVNFLFVKMKLNQYSRKTNFRIDGDKYVMTYSQATVNIYVKTKKDFNDTFEFTNDFVTMDYKQGGFELDKKLRYGYKTLFNAGNNHTTDYWKTSNIILLSPKEEAMLQTLK